MSIFDYEKKIMKAKNKEEIDIITSRMTKEELEEVIPILTNRVNLLCLQSQLDNMANTNMTDLEKWENFLLLMNIGYKEKKNCDTGYDLDINYQHIHQDYGNSIDILFDEDGKFIEFRACGE